MATGHLELDYLVFTLICFRRALLEILGCVITTTPSGSRHRTLVRSSKVWHLMSSIRTTSLSLGADSFLQRICVSHELKCDPNTRTLFLQGSAADDWPTYDKIRGFDWQPDNFIWIFCSAFFFTLSNFTENSVCSVKFTKCWTRRVALLPAVSYLNWNTGNSGKKTRVTHCMPKSY